MTFDMTPARALLLSRTTPAERPPAAFPFLPATERSLRRDGGAVAWAAVLMALATTANVARHWNDGRR